MLGAVLLGLATTACNDNDDREVGDIDLRENKVQRQEVYSQILNDQDLFTEFMEEIRQNRQSMLRMGTSRPMMQHFYGRDQMRSMMRRDPLLRQELMRNMMTIMEKDTLMMTGDTTMTREMIQNMETMMQQDSLVQERMLQRLRENPQMRQNMMRNLMIMVQKDSMMHNRMRQMMMEGGMMEGGMMGDSIMHQGQMQRNQMQTDTARTRRMQGTDTVQ